MKKSFIYHKFFIIFLVLFSSENVVAQQLSFCQGNSGDPIFTETFGTGTSYGPALPAGTIDDYSFVENSGPQDGEYTIGPLTFSYGWNLPSDHTGDVNGKALIVNASTSAGEFYRTTVSGLCEKTTYEFSSFLINILPQSGCGGNGIPINVQFEIWDNTETNRLAWGDTGDIFGTLNPTWQEYALVFQTLEGQTSVVLKMKNKGSGGCGNDLAIDDIVFKTCGDYIEVTDTANTNSVSLCSNQTPYNTTFTATPDNIVFIDHFYQWQESVDAVAWTDMIGETNQTLSVSGIISTIHYRAKVAEYAINLSNSDCITFSNVFSVNITQVPAQPPNVNCWDNYQLETASCSYVNQGTAPINPGNVTCWDDFILDSTTCTYINQGAAPTNPGNVNCWDDYQLDTTTCMYVNLGTVPINPGNVTCWDDFQFNTATCQWENIGVQPMTERTETYSFCEDEDITLVANTTLINPDYYWNSGEITQNLTVSNPETYTVEISDGCTTEIINFNITQIDKPIIERIVSDGSNIIVETTNIGDFLYSLNGVDYQSNNTFFNVQNGAYVVYVKNSNDCNQTFATHIHFAISKFFTPNNDGVHDTFNLQGIENYGTSEVYLFNRYGKLLKSAKNQPFYWDGTFNNQELPTGDYWYIIKIDNQEIKGHFTLKR